MTKRDIHIAEVIENNVYECMDWMENEIKCAAQTLMERNKKNLEYAQKHWDDGYYSYAEGFHDALLEILNELEIDIDEEYCNG